MDKRTVDADLIIFDLDGTLINSGEDIAWCANNTLAAMGKPEMPLDVVIGHIGWGVKPLMEKLMPGEPDDVINKARSIFLDFYGGHLVVKTFIYPGVIQTLDFFESIGKKMTIVTNKPIGLTVGILERLDLTRYFKMVLGGDSLPNKKPHPEPVEKVIKEMAASPKRSVIVGDSPVDCQAGMAAGANAIGVSYGFRGALELSQSGCEIIVDTFPELKDVIK